MRLCLYFLLNAFIEPYYEILIKMIRFKLLYSIDFDNMGTQMASALPARGQKKKRVISEMR